jgi:hypothetical protein
MMSAAFADKVTLTGVWNEIEDLTGNQGVIDKGIATLQ